MSYRPLFCRRKLTRLDEDNARRRVIARYYTENIRKDCFALPYSDAQLIGEDHVFHIFPLRSPQRTELQSHLSQAGIETLIHYPVPVHWQECLLWSDTCQFAFRTSGSLGSRGTEFTD